MGKTTLQANLSVKSIENLRKQIEKIKTAIENGSENFVQYATLRLYELIMSNCVAVGINNHSANIKYEYNENTKTGRVYTSDMVIIFNEFGTGIKGTQDEWANKHGYKVNASGKGADGWWYPSNESDPNPHKWITPNGEIRALTHGLESRHMFYDALVQIQNEFNDMIEITIGKALGDLY